MKRLLMVAALLTISLVTGCDEEQVKPAKPKPPTVQVLDFGASWCGPCIANKPAIKRLERRGLKVQHIDIDVRPDLKTKYGITSVPTYIVFRDGKEVERTQSVGRLTQIVTPLPKNNGESRFPRL